MKNKRLVIIGGGASGFFCAANAAKFYPSLEVIIVEKTGKVLQKVRVSGGGRCNTTHACFEKEEMAKRYPRGERFIKKAFYQFFTTDTIQWFEERGVQLKTEDDGRMFPVSNSSQTIIDCLESDISKYNVKVWLHRDVKSIEKSYTGFELHFNSNEILDADFVMIATGGFPKLSQYDWLKNLNLSIASPVPSLFTFNFPQHSLNNLMGLSVQNASVKIADTKLISEGPILITHWGLSGPAILRLSAFAAIHLSEKNYDFKIFVNWNKKFKEHELAKALHDMRFESPNQKVVNGNFTELPSRLWEYLLAESGIDDTKRWSDLSSGMVNKLARNICNYEMNAMGKTTFKEEFVSAGGIDLNEIDVNTMMSKKHSGLFFGGEIMNIDGITGGYNFQHAWTSAYIAAKGIGKLLV